MLEDKKGLNKKGIGLGLNIAKQICNVFGGDIILESELGKGSNFKFFFDVTPPRIDEEHDLKKRASDEIYRADCTEFYFKWRPSS